MAYRITKIKCPDKTYLDINHEEDEAEGWPEVESIILSWLEFAGKNDLCLVSEFLSVIAHIPVEFAAERLESLYEKDLAFKSIDDGIAMFCAEDPDDFDDPDDPDDGPDGPDGGEPIPEDLDIPNNYEFYPLDVRKVANDMLKELIKMASEFDRLGLRKEADKIDTMIRKVAGENWRKQRLNEPGMTPVVTKWELQTGDDNESPARDDGLDWLDSDDVFRAWEKGSDAEEDWAEESDEEYDDRINRAMKLK